MIMIPAIPNNRTSYSVKILFNTVVVISYIHLCYGCIRFSPRIITGGIFISSLTFLVTRDGSFRSNAVGAGYFEVIWTVLLNAGPLRVGTMSSVAAYRWKFEL
jgi:hypothetical protein